MKQGQSSPPKSQRVRLWSPGDLRGSPQPLLYTPMGVAIQSRGVLYWAGRFIGGILGILWATITLPLRLVIGIIGVAGRLVGIFLGFMVMVVGVALWAGPLFILGIPLFVVGLLLTLRCLS